MNLSVVKKTILNNKKVFYIINVLTSTVIGFLAFLYFPVTLRLEMETDTKGLVNISYSKDNFTEDGHSIYFNTKVTTNFEKYNAKIPVTNFSAIRINPISFPGSFKIKSFSYKYLLKEVTLDKEKLISSIKPLEEAIQQNSESDIYYEAEVLEKDAYLEIMNDEFFENIERNPERYLISFFITTTVFLLGLLFFNLLKLGAINKRNLFITNLVISLIIIAFPPDSISFIKAFASVILLYAVPGYLFLYKMDAVKPKMYIHTKFLLSIVTGFSLWFVLLFITSQLGIPIPSSIIYLIVGVCLTSFLYILYKNSYCKKNRKILNITNTDLIMFSLFNILLFVFIVPLKGLHVTPLHDPAAISINAKLLLASKYILNNLPKDYLFYPPAGFFLVALPSGLLGITTSKMTMILTNLFNILCGFAFATMMKKLFKGKYLAILSVIVFSFISLYPASEYFRAGKNAQVISFVFLFISLYFFYNAIDKDIKSKLLFGISLFTSVLMHYNNIAITAILCIAIYIYKRLKDKNLSFKIVYKDILKWIPVLIFVIGLLYIQLNTIKSIEYSSSNILLSQKTFSTINLKAFYDWFTKYKNFRVPENIISLGIISYFLLLGRFLFNLFKNKKITYDFVFIIIFLLGFYISTLSPIDSIRSYSHINKFLVYIIPITISLNYLLQNTFKLPILSKNKNKYFQIISNSIIIVFILIIGFKNTQLLFKQFNHVRIYSVVQDADLKAFEWIDTNFSSKSRFLPAHIEGLHPSDYTLLYDSSLYMKAFSDSYEVFTFVYGNELPNEPELAEEYIALTSNPSDKNILNKFSSSGVNYIFSGSVRPWGCGYVPCDLFDQYPETYNVIYDEGGVKIYEILIVD